jgi:polyhydroxybutyrate depolymerase
MRKKHTFFKLFCVSALLLSMNLKAQTTVIDSFMHGGVMRNYRLYIPAIYHSTKAVPLIFNFHGLGSNAAQQEFYGDFRPIADTADFILCHPNGTVGPNGQGWNNFGAVGSGVDDIGFVSALMDTIRKKYSIDTTQMFSTGMSNGGFMSYELACYLSKRITAIASVSGSMISSHYTACNATHPTPVMEVHGTADPVVSYPGNGGIVASIHIDTLVKHWVKYNHCNLTPVVTQVPNINTTDGCTAEHQVFLSGNSGSTVELFKIIGGGHSWPNAPVNTSNGPTNRDFSASKEIWRFFRQYHLNIHTGFSELKTASPQVNVYPNPASSGFELDFGTASPGLYTIRVFNASGQEVIFLQDHQAHLYIPRANLAAGLYSIQISVDGNSIVKKLILN